MKKYSTDYRKRALSMVSGGKKISEVCLILGICRATIYRWQSQLSKSGTLADKPQKSYFRKLDPQELLEYVEKHPGKMRKDYAHHFNVSPSSIGDAFKRLGITRKKRLIAIRNEMSREDRYFWIISKE